MRLFSAAEVLNFLAQRNAGWARRRPKQSKVTLGKKKKLAQLGGLTVADGADSCGRSPIDYNRFGSTLADIETCLISVMRKQALIYELIATVKRATDEARDSLESRGLPQDKAIMTIPNHIGQVNIMESVLMC